MKLAGSGRFIAVLVSAGALLALGATVFAAAPAIDPCKLLTPAEVESVTGHKVPPVLRNHYEGNKWSCDYGFSGEEEFGFLLEIGPFRAWLERYTYLSKTAVSVNGLGGEAWMDHDVVGGQGQVLLLIRKGNGPWDFDTPALHLRMVDTAQDEKIKALAKKAIGRL